MSTTSFDGVPTAATVLYQEKVTAVPRTVAAGDDLWLTLRDLEAASGWALKPEGVCREELCVPLPDDRRARFIREGSEGSWFNVAEFARLVEQPFARDDVHNVWYFGSLGWEWKRRLDSPLAPDFTLPDLQGRRYSLSDFRGKKVLLACWASW